MITRPAVSEQIKTQDMMGFFLIVTLHLPEFGLLMRSTTELQSAFCVRVYYCCDTHLYDGQVVIASLLGI